MMKSNFLNLPSSAAGDARRHVPFKSIINKHFSILFVLVFVFSILFSYVHPVAALADPVFQPVYDTQFYQLPQFVDPLNSTQQDIFYFILGSQVVEYAGLSDYQIENPYSDPSSVGEWFKKIGIDLYNDVLESFAIAGAPIIAGAKWVKDLYANIAGAANFAGAFNNSSWSDWYNDVQTNGLSLELYPSMFGALNQFFARNGGLYDWQYSEHDWDRYFTWNIHDISGSNLTNYLNYYSEYFSTFPVQVNTYNSTSYTNFYITDDRFNSLINYKYLFFNTSNGRASLVDNNGNSLGQYAFNPSKLLYYFSIGSGQTIYNGNNSTYYYALKDYYSFNTSNNILDEITTFFNNTKNMFNSFSNYYLYSDLFWLDSVYYGTSWNNRVLAVNSDNLNLDQNSNQDILMPILNTLLDIKGLINDILEQNGLKQPALDNLTDLNGDPLPATQLQPVSVAVELPDSGITINSGLFTPLTKDGGYINYLWYMTKPLVQYTSDFIQTLVFPDDTGEGFDATGPGVIVFGVICLGLIGGLVVKCLL